LAKQTKFAIPVLPVLTVFEYWLITFVITPTPDERVSIGFAADVLSTEFNTPGPLVIVAVIDSDVIAVPLPSL